MQRYSKYNDLLIAFACPACNQSIEIRPAPKGEVWNTLSGCPHCNAMFIKIAEGEKAYGLIPGENVTVKVKAAKAAQG